jgi:hypothetical protein
MAPTVKRGSRLPVLPAQTLDMSGLPRAGGVLARLPKTAEHAGAERQRVGAGNRPLQVAE